jgi:ABC-type multidrug transport system fused ATPase/permease subunit
MIWLYSHILWEKMMMALVRTNLFESLLERAGRSNQPGGYAISPGDAVSRLRDDVESATDVINEWYRLSGHASFAVAALAIMWRIDPWVTLGAVLPLAGVVTVVHRLRFRLAAAWQQARADTSRVTAFISELFGAILAVQVAGAERSVLGRFHQLNEQRRRSTLQHSLISSLIASFNDNIVNLGGRWFCCWRRGALPRRPLAWATLLSLWSIWRNFSNCRGGSDGCWPPARRRRSRRRGWLHWPNMRLQRL